MGEIDRGHRRRALDRLWHRPGIVAQGVGRGSRRCHAGDATDIAAEQSAVGRLTQCATPRRR